MGHSDVMGFARQLVEDFVVAHHRHQPGPWSAQRQRAIVEAAATPQSHPGSVDGKCGYQHHPGPGHLVGRQPRLRRFPQTEPGRHKRAGHVPAPLQRQVPAGGVGGRDRQQHLIAKFKQPRRHGLRARLGPHRQVGAHHPGAGDHLREVVAQLLGLGVMKRGGQLPSGGQQSRPVLGFWIGRHGLHCDSANAIAPSRAAARVTAVTTRQQVSVPRTAIVPAAGLGTRFLPATKTIPKELLPVVDTPGIELVAEEAAEAGAERLVIVTAEGKDGVVAHFVEDLVLEGTLEARGKKSMLEKVRRASALIKVESVIQDEPLGLGHAVGCVEPVLLPDEDAVAVLLPDDLVLPSGVLLAMAKVRAEYGGTVLCAIEVTPEEISAYGVFDVEPIPGEPSPDVLRVKGMVEKPKTSEAPSLLAAAGRYILDRAIFDALRRVERGAGGEIQLTDAIALLIAEGHPVHVVVHRGTRHDLGNPGGYLKAAVDFALDRDDYGPDLRRWLMARLGMTEQTR